MYNRPIPVELGPLPLAAAGGLLTVQHAAYVSAARLYDDGLYRRRGYVESFREVLRPGLELVHLDQTADHRTRRTGRGGLPVSGAVEARGIGEYLISARSFAEYTAMFALTDADLAGRVLDCPGGAASFTASACSRGGDAVAVDPIYADAEDLAGRLEAELARGSAWAATHFDRYVWDFYGDPAAHARLRAESARLFTDDLFTHPDRYVAGALPRLPFADNTFDLVLSSHLLFTYADRLDTDFHLAALREMARVSRSRVRIYPLVDQAGQPLPDLLHRLVQELAADALTARLRDVDYEFQRGARTMLELQT